MKETGDKFHSYCFLTYYQEENTTIRRLAFNLSCRRHEKKKKMHILRVWINLPINGKKTMDGYFLKLSWSARRLQRQAKKQRKGDKFTPPLGFPILQITHFLAVGEKERLGEGDI